MNNLFIISLFIIFIILLEKKDFITHYYSYLLNLNLKKN